MLHSPTRLVFYTIDYFTRNIHFLDRLLFIYIHTKQLPDCCGYVKGRG
uniref:Uncharacterized protein n=1 Tax=Anguilla anguilla TaxID=7936 RepID=A0A0E9R8Y0_ANGAN